MIITTPPWNYPEFVVCAGRYYLAHYYFDLPKGKRLPMGGNVAFLVWRYNDEPMLWRGAICFRYYRDENVVISEDRKEWKFFTVHGDEAYALQHCNDMSRAMWGSVGIFFLETPPEVERMEVHGDCEKYIETVQRVKPSWLHSQSADETPPGEVNPPLS